MLKSDARDTSAELLLTRAALASLYFVGATTGALAEDHRGVSTATLTFLRQGWRE
jgi:hypothetical protein